MNTVETKELTKYYLNGKVKALESLSLDIQEGEIFGFIGPNGAGKTTTIRLLLDLIRPTSGGAKIFGFDVRKESLKIRQEIGYLPGEIFLPENMTGKECLSYYQSFKKYIDKSYVKKMTSKLDLDLNKKISQYSKGNRQKLAIILALMHKPKFLILDEPTSGLDPLNQETFYNLMLETKEQGTTTFFSTHILAEAEKICDRVGILKDGKLLKIEDIDDFKAKNIREIHLETDASIPLAELKIDGIKKIERTTKGYRIISAGQNGNILRELAKHSIKDIRISEPSLEEIFLRYYKD